jgi:hypothetical protein
MATCPPVPTPEVLPPPDAATESAGLGSESLRTWTTQSAKAEAQMLFAMMARNGETVGSVRELIQVPANVEAALRTYALEPATSPLSVVNKPLRLIAIVLVYRTGRYNPVATICDRF